MMFFFRDLCNIPEFRNANLCSIPKDVEKGTNPGGLGGGSPFEA